MIHLGLCCGPVAKTPELPMKGAWIQHLVGELRSHILNVSNNKIKQLKKKVQEAEVWQSSSVLEAQGENLIPASQSLFCSRVGTEVSVVCWL